MKRESIADLGYIKLYLTGYVKDNQKANNNPKEYNDFTLTRCIELVEAIIKRETKQRNKK